MKSRREGTIINVGSALSERAIPLQSAYVASKHGLRGFTEALRLELMHEDAGIEVVLILPSSMNTPLFNFARSKLGVQPMPVPPVYEPRVVAEAICHAAEHGGREIVVGGWGKLLIAGQWLSPSPRPIHAPGRPRLESQKTQRPDDARDNLFEASTGPGATTGQFGQDSKSTSLYTTHLELYPNRKRIAGAAPPRAAGGDPTHRSLTGGASHQPSSPGRPSLHLLGPMRARHRPRRTGPRRGSAGPLRRQHAPAFTAGGHRQRQGAALHLRQSGGR